MLAAGAVAGCGAATGGGDGPRTAEEPGAVVATDTGSDAGSSSGSDTDTGSGSDTGPDAGSGMGTASGADAPATSTPPGPLPPSIAVQVARLEAEAAEIDSFRALLARVAREVEVLPDARLPTACASGLRDELARIVREGGPAASYARGHRASVDDLCERFERWGTPTAALETRIRSYLAHLGRIEEWMRDILGCTEHGYDARCENAYGPAEPDDRAEAREALAVVARVRRELEGVPERRPFPCRSPLFAELVARSWSTSTARAQMPDLGRSARDLCRGIGVDATELSTLVRRIRDDVARDDASAAQLASSRRTSAAQVRAAAQPAQ